MDVRNAPAGKEINRLCAETMGWKLKGEGWITGKGTDEKGEFYIIRMWWEPSTEIGDAWILFKAVQGKDDLFKKFTNELRRTDWGLESWVDMLKRLDALMICKAFLIANGIEEIEIPDDN